jgi:hypothetical protein
MDARVPKRRRVCESGPGTAVCSKEGRADAAETEFGQMSANDRPVITRKGLEDGNTAQSGGLKLITGVGPQHTPATRLWFGKPPTRPGSDRCRTITARPKPAPIYCLAAPGFISVRTTANISSCPRATSCSFRPSCRISMANMSTTEELWWLACRTPENIVVNLPDVEDNLLAGYRRA